MGAVGNTGHLSDEQACSRMPINVSSVGKWSEQLVRSVEDESQVFAVPTAWITLKFVIQVRVFEEVHKMLGPSPGGDDHLYHTEGSPRYFAAYVLL